MNKKEVIMVEPLTTAIITSALSEFVKQLTVKILNTTWDSDVESGKTILEQLSRDHISNRYIKDYVSKQLRMRTLHSAEADVLLEEIYSPLRVVSRHKDGDDEIVIDDGVIIDFPEIVNIIGLAGQGKSTILRKLFLEEIKCKKRFPIFIELRRLDSDTIINYIRNIFLNVGVIISNDALEMFLISKKVVLMLDGFDEIKDVHRHRILNEIKNLNTRYQCPVLVTSRPDTEVCLEATIKNIYVEKLNKREIISIINKLDVNRSNSELPEIIATNQSLLGTLVTPILVNLLYVCYPYMDNIPSNVNDFYDKLFMILYSRHDKIKNFNREKSSKISASDAKEIFNALSFNSIINNQLDFTSESLLKNLESSIRLTSITNPKTEDIQKDIINVTCLIQKDGFDHYVYLHKSVAEFHAAAFIASVASDTKKRIYKALVNKAIDNTIYDPLINYLKGIDLKDFNSLFIVGFCEANGIDGLKYNSESFYKRLEDSIFKDTNIRFNINSDKTISLASHSSLHYKNLVGVLSLISFGNRFSKFLDDALSGVFIKGVPYENIDDGTQEKFYVLDVENGIEFKLLKDKLDSKSFKDSYKIVRIAENVGTDVVTVDLRSFLKAFDSYDIIIDCMKKEISSFYNSTYLPIKDNLEKVGSLIEFGLS